VLKAVGNEYTVKIIDGEDCVYRDLGEYEIEISGCAEKRKPFSVYVWKKFPQMIVYRKQVIKTLPRLCGELNYVMELYHARLQGVPFPEED
jgi:hypothetical protein